jgi:hypothetical protein
MVGQNAYNKDLGQRRANATKEFLMAHGVTEDRIKTISYGEAVPVVQTELAEPENRRILVVAVHKEPIVKTEVVTETKTVPVRQVEYVERRVDVPVIVEKEPPDAFDFDIIGGAGVMGNLDGDTTDVASIGGTWNLRMTINTRYHLGVEAAYVGSYQDLADSEGFTDNKLMGNGIEGALRINVLNDAVRPYVYGGLGWTHFNVTDRPLSENVLTIPVGAGIDFDVYEGVLIDVRGGVRPALEDDLLDDTQVNGEDASLDTWSATAQAGYAF